MRYPKEIVRDLYASFDDLRRTGQIWSEVKRGEQGGLEEEKRENNFSEAWRRTRDCLYRAFSHRLILTPKQKRNLYLATGNIVANYQFLKRAVNYITRQTIGGDIGD
ncbi:MAG: hypothetical protein HYX24_06900 [Candidatus Aenigmarchaeota archaeon]|nr:hypothetical protein [Candidatus Aenigmarchaeota archaeon]